LVKYRRFIPAPALAAGLIVFGAGLVLYGRTMLRDVGTWDTAEFQAIGPVLGIAHPTGYPTYTLLAWLASVVLQPFGDPALRANLLSVICVAGAAGLVAATVALLTGRWLIGIAAGAALAVAADAWAVALRADPHALHLLLAASLLAVLVAWARRVGDRLPADGWLLAAALLYGISLGNHALTALLAPGIALFVFTAHPPLLRRPLFVVGCALLALGAALAAYAYLPIRSAMNPPLDYANPQTLDNLRYLVFGEQFSASFTGYPPLGEAIQTVSRLALDQLGPFALLAGLGFVLALWRRLPLALLLAGWALLTWLFALGYANADIGRYHLVPLLCLAILGALGASGLWTAAELAVQRVTRPASRRPAQLGIAVVAAVLLITPSLSSVPDRLDLLDRSAESFGRRWLEAVLPQLEPDAMVVSWWSFSTPIWYAQFVEGQRPDIEVIDDSTIVHQRLGDAAAVIDSNLGHRPVYLVRLRRDLPAYSARYRLSPLAGLPLAGDGAVYRVEGYL
jgi:hypothetical protein